MEKRTDIVKRKEEVRKQEKEKQRSIEASDK